MTIEELKMWQDFVVWMQEPSKWNDGAVLCAVGATICLIYMLIKDN